MKTHRYMLGSPGPLVIGYPSDAEIPVPGVAAQLRIEIEDACVMVNAPGPGPEFVFDLNSTDLRPGFYRTSFYYDAADGEGLGLHLRFNLHLKGGC